jgi:hypothetical protein
MLHLDTGNTGFMLLCSSLVMLMTPGLAFFYGGLVGRKNVLAIMIQSFVSMGWTTVIWWLCGFSLCFSGGQGGIIGDLHLAFLRNVNLGTPSPNDTIPMFVFCAYQMMFAIITPALITGAFANRVTFKAYMLFLTAWLLFVYFPFVHMIWGGGILQKWGILDFAGGIVVHNIAGMAALASVIYVGLDEDGLGSAQHPARGARHRPSLVRVVRLQRGQRVPGGRDHGGGVPEHGSRRVVRGFRVARGVLDAVAHAQVLRPGDGGGGGPRDGDAGSGYVSPTGGGDRHHLRRGLLPPWREESRWPR